MPILQVQHVTTYRYRRSVALGVHRLMLRPRDSHDLRLISAELTLSPTAELTWSYDVFGNSIARAAFCDPADTLSVTSRIIVEQCAPAWPVFVIETFAHQYPFAYSIDERLDLGALLVPQYPDPEQRLKNWAQAFVLGPRTDTLSLLKDLNAGVLDWASYQFRADEGTQTPLETLTLGRGACRDLAVLFVEAARALGFGARIVSGYLYAPDTSLSATQGFGSTHAWAEIYLPGAGWIAFDPTNRTFGGSHLLRIAVARDISQVAPIAGSFLGAPRDFVGLDVAVSVAPA